MATAKSRRSSRTSRNAARLALLMLSLGAVAACGIAGTGSDREIDVGDGVDPGVARSAVRLAEKDQRFASLLSGDGRATVKTHQYGLTVEIPLSTPVAEDDLSIDTCTVPRSGPVTAMRCIVGEGGTVLSAVSPVWSTVSCV